MARNVPWPALEVRYEEEFGPVDTAVDRVAQNLWPQAQRYANVLLHDPVEGYSLLKRAVAAVSRVTADGNVHVKDLAAYLFQTYKRLVLAELEKRNGHRLRDLDAVDLSQPLGDEATRIDRQILIAELLSRMDTWTREVFEALALGYSFDEIGRAMGSNPHVVRNHFRLGVQRLRAALERDLREVCPHRCTLGSLRQLRMMRDRLLGASSLGRPGPA